MRILGLDYGEKRIGVAISDGLGITANPRPFIPTSKSAISEVKALVDDEEVSEVVVGLPKNRHGEATKQTEKVQNWAKRLEVELDCDVTYWDERYSTQAVEKVLIEANVSRAKRKTVIDSQAAAYILQGYLDYIRTKKDS